MLRDLELDGAGNFKRYQVKYYHDAQPRADGQGKPHRASTLISDVEGNSLLYHASRGRLGRDRCQRRADLRHLRHRHRRPGAAYGVWRGDDCPEGNLVTCTNPLDDPTDNYANMWLNHFYIYADLEGTIPPGVTSQEVEQDSPRRRRPGRVPEERGRLAAADGPGR